jgi:1,4-dihydroxy-2-naphthoate octaprenyltransferase
MAVKDWIQASRLRTLPLAASCVLVGAAISFPETRGSELLIRQFWPVFTVILMTVILLQILSNWANDWGDFENGADDASRQDRAVASGRISAAKMKSAVLVLAIVAFVCGLVALFLSFFFSGSFIASIAFVSHGNGRNCGGLQLHGWKQSLWLQRFR